MSSSATNDFQAYSGPGSDRKEMLDFVPSSAKVVLDVGCSVGNFGALLKKERGVEVWGIEADPQAADIASDKLDKVVAGLFGQKQELNEKKFDCIVFNDVLEHMVDPYSALAYAKTLLNPKGHIVASIPNVRYFDNLWKLVINGSWEYEDTGLLDRTHLRFFTKSSIEKMFSEQGYAIERITGISAVDWCHPERRQLFRFLNFLLLNRLAETRWLQFAVVAQPAQGNALPSN